MKFYGLRLLALSSLSLLGACADEVAGPKGPLQIAVAPLSYPGLADVCYGLTVYNGDPSVFGTDTVWSQTGVCSSQYGNTEGGDITYIGPCDADVDGNNFVELVLESVEVEGGDILDDQNTTIDGDADFENPCPEGAPCTLDFECVENADVFVEFNLTIMRDAEQGFFDVAVNFDDIFCSFKFDSCYDNGDGDDIELLFGDTSGEVSIVDGDGRDHTAVFAMACTAGPGVDIDTEILISNVILTCGEQSFPLPLTNLDQGNQSVFFDPDDDGNATHQVQYGLYYGDEQLNCGEAEAQVIENGQYFYGLGGSYYALQGTEQAGLYDWTLYAVGDPTQTVLTTTTAATPPESFTFVPPGNEASQTIYQQLEMQPTSCNKGYYNIALNMEDLPATGCTLSLEATAQDANDPVLEAGAISGQGTNYPFMQLAAAPVEGCFAWAPGDMDGDEPGPLQVVYHTSNDMVGGSPASLMCHTSNGGVAKPIGGANENIRLAYATIADAEKVAFNTFGRFKTFGSLLRGGCDGRTLAPARTQESLYIKSDAQIVTNKYQFTAVTYEATETARAEFIKANALFVLGGTDQDSSFEIAKYDYNAVMNYIQKGEIITNDRLSAKVTGLYLGVIIKDSAARLIGEANLAAGRLEGSLLDVGIVFNR